MENSSFVNDTIDNPIHTNRYQSDPQACSESHDLLLLHRSAPPQPSMSTPAGPSHVPPGSADHARSASPHS